MINDEMVLMRWSQFFQVIEIFFEMPTAWNIKENFIMYEQKLAKGIRW